MIIGRRSWLDACESWPGIRDRGETTPIGSSVRGGLERQMLRSVKNLQKYRIVATDGAIGRVNQFFFDDERWTVRYLVADTGNWLPGRRVLISPFSIRHVDWIAGEVSLSITRGMVKSSPDIDTQKPVSRQQEADYLRYYRYPYYWAGAGLWGPGAYPAGLAAESAADVQAPAKAEQEGASARGDSHLRSSKEVIGYHLQAADGELGHVDDFLVEDDSWTIRYVVVDTSNWWLGKHILVPPDWIRKVSWSQKKVHVDLTRETVKGAPEYDPAALLDRQWEADYYAHYRRAPYWGARTTNGSSERRELDHR
jgi:hypothetical protein